MKPTDHQLAGLNVALNEARLLGLDYHPVQRIAAVVLSVLTLPEDGPAPEMEISLRVWPVSRIAAALVTEDGQLKPFEIGALSDLLQSFGGQPIYGWEFFDTTTPAAAEWLRQPSLDFRAGDAGASHTLHLFQEAGSRKLDVCVWFNEVEVRDGMGHEVPIDAFTAGGKRWWDGVFSGDPRTGGSGIHPLKE